eukprot:Nk52_evm16s267 gene=Nk52_evmTU16s267
MYRGGGPGGGGQGQIMRGRMESASNDSLSSAGVVVGGNPLKNGSGGSSIHSNSNGSLSRYDSVSGGVGIGRADSHTSSSHDNKTNNSSSSNNNITSSRNTTTTNIGNSGSGSNTPTSNNNNHHHNTHHLTSTQHGHNSSTTSSTAHHNPGHHQQQHQGSHEDILDVGESFNPFFNMGLISDLSSPVSQSDDVDDFLRAELNFTGHHPHQHHPGPVVGMPPLNFLPPTAVSSTSSADQATAVMMNHHQNMLRGMGSLPGNGGVGDRNTATGASSTSSRNSSSIASIQGDGASANGNSNNNNSNNNSNIGGNNSGPGGGDNKSKAKIGSGDLLTMLQNQRSSNPKNNSFGKKGTKSANTVFQKQEKFTVMVEAPTSIAQRLEEDTLTYLNKNQNYTINFEANMNAIFSEKRKGQNATAADLYLAKSVIHLIFHHEKEQQNERENWRYWRSQQTKANCRAFVVDRKASTGMIDYEELAFNCVSFVWDTRDGAKVPISLNCLSTDFSAQKGVRGIPLRLQVDTYDDLDSGYYEAIPVHRCFSQVKVFRDKGAERKNKDEAKTAEKRIIKLLKHHEMKFGDTQGFKSPFCAPSAWTKMTGTTPLGIKPDLLDSYLNEEMEDEDAIVGEMFNIKQEDEQLKSFSQIISETGEELENLDMELQQKSRKGGRRARSVLTIYVRTEEEKVYNPIHLHELTVEDLKIRIGAKYEIAPGMIKSVLKRTKKGITVRLDDKVVELFGDEDDFIVSLEFDNQEGTCTLSLSSN